MSARPRLLPCGEHALLVELGSLAEVLAFAAAAEQRIAARSGAWAAVRELVPAARTVLVLGADDAGIDPLRTAVDEVDLTAAPVTRDEDTEPLTIEVHYDGDDLAEVARLTGLSAAEVVRAHTGREWRVAFGGFAPGFGYLTGGDDRLNVPRRTEPRTFVPAGAVALAGGLSAVYPRSSPGGWQLIGRTDEVLFDVERNPPALLERGRRVRFVALDGTGGD